MFDWEDARYFLAVARQRSLSGAGRVLGVRQSTVGRRLAGLEGALGTRLFDRTPDGYLATAAGETLLRRAERMEEESFAIERELSGQETRVAGVVRMTAAQAFGNLFVVPLLARMRRALPDVLVELVADNATLSLTKREADLALRLGRPQQPLLVVRRLGDVANGLYASREYLSRRGTPRGDQLEGHDFVDYDESYLQKQAIAWFRQRSRGGRCSLRVNSSHGIASAVQSGLGVGPLPCWLGDGLPDLVRVLPRHGYLQDLWLVLHRDLRHVARVRAVADVLAGEVRRSAATLLGRRRPGK